MAILGVGPEAAQVEVVDPAEVPFIIPVLAKAAAQVGVCLLYTSDAADDPHRV
jgi:hypothetical protein